MISFWPCPTKNLEIVVKKFLLYWVHFCTVYPSDGETLKSNAAHYSQLIQGSCHRTQPIRMIGHSIGCKLTQMASKTMYQDGFHHLHVVLLFPAIVQLRKTPNGKKWRRVLCTIGCLIPFLVQLLRFSGAFARYIILKRLQKHKIGWRCTILLQQFANWYVKYMVKDTALENMIMANLDHKKTRYLVKTITSGLKIIRKIDAEFFRLLGRRSSILYGRQNNWATASNREYIENHADVYEVYTISIIQLNNCRYSTKF